MSEEVAESGSADAAVMDSPIVESEGVTAESLFADDGDAGEQVAEETQGGEDWTPPSREEWLELEGRANLVDLQLEQLLQGKEEPSEEVTPVTPEEAQARLTPREFTPNKELLDRVLVDGESGALVELLENHTEVMQHNQAISMNKAIMNALTYSMPVFNALGKFYDKFPETVAARNYVEEQFWQTRLKHPGANELQVLRLTEKRLQPLIEKARKIAGSAGGAAPRTHTPGSVGSAATPSPRQRQDGSGKFAGANDTETHLNRLRQWAAKNG